MAAVEQQNSAKKAGGSPGSRAPFAAADAAALAEMPQDSAGTRWFSKRNSRQAGMFLMCQLLR